MMAEYDQPLSQRGYQQYDQQPSQRGFHQYDQQPSQRGYQQHDQRGYQQHDQSPNQRGYQQHDQRGYQQHDQSPNQRGYQQHDQRGYQQYDPQQQQQAQQRATLLERGRAIRLMRNGDPHYPGRAFVINHRKYPMLEVFLDDASRVLHANFGAIRQIYTPKHGTRLQDISDFEDHRTYVAAGGERFKKLHYLDIAEGKRVPHKGQSGLKLPPVPRMDVEGRALKLARSENVIIFVYRNGDPLTLPAKVLLVKSTLQNWECVLDEVTRKVSLTNSAVLKLYAMNGELITSAHQLEYNGMYVAAGKERFRRIDYPDPKSFSPTFSPKNSRKSSKHHLTSVHSRMTLPMRQKRAGNFNAQYYHQPASSVIRRRYTKSDGTNTHTTTATSHGSLENVGQRRPVRDEYDFFNNKPQQHRRGPTKETDLDRDDGGIYKSRVNHREQAREIDETRDTKIDLPVDYREVQTIDEENLYGNAGKTPRRQHQLPPSNQPFLDARQRPIKSPQKNLEDENQIRYPYTANRINGFDNDYPTRNPVQNDDDRYEQPSNHSTYRQALISSSTQPNKKSENEAAIVIQSHIRGYFTRKQTHHDQLKQQQQQHHPYDMQHEESNIDQYRQPSIMTEREYDDDDNL